MANLEEKASKALLKFCEDHHYNPVGLAELRACVKALESGRQRDALIAFGRIPLGGMGTFGDWIPSPMFPNETSEYVTSLFDALLFWWTHLMRELEKRLDK